MNSITAETLAASLSREERRRRLYGTIISVVLLYLLVKTFQIAEDMNSGGFINGLSQFFDYPADILEDALASGWSWYGILLAYVPAMVETINMALLGTVLGGVFALGLSTISTRGLQVWPPLIHISRRCMDIMRAFPELIIALFLIFMLGTSPIPAIIAIMIHTTGALGKLFSEVNENINFGQVEGLQSTGASWLQRIRFGVWSQVAPNYLSYALLRFEINIRASAILGFVGAGGIGTELRKAIGWSKGEDISALFILLFITIVIIDQSSAWLRRRLTHQVVRESP